MREFILRALKAKTSPDFTLDDLPGSGGRMDLVCRCISNSLFVAQDMRRDTIFHAVLEGPLLPPKIVSFFGETLRNVAPDERNVASHIQRALEEGRDLKLGEEKEISPGIKVFKKSFERLIKEKSENSQLIYLNKKGKDMNDFEFKKNVVIVLGDHIGLPRESEKLLKRLKSEKLSLGPKTYLASHCIVIVHNILDRRGI